MPNPKSPTKSGLYFPLFFPFTQVNAVKIRCNKNASQTAKVNRDLTGIIVRIGIIPFPSQKQGALPVLTPFKKTKAPGNPSAFNLNLIQLRHYKHFFSAAIAAS